MSSALAQRQPPQERPAAAHGGHDRRCTNRGHPAHRAGNGPLLPAAAARRRLGRGADRSIAEGAVRDRAVRRREVNSRGQYTGRPGRRKPDHQPHCVRRKFEDLRQGSQRRGPGARPGRVYAYPGTKRCPAHYRVIPPAGALRRDRRAQDHPAAREPGRRRFRDQRRTIDRHPRDKLRRQPQIRRLDAARRYRDEGKPLVPVLIDVGHLRSRSRRLRSRVAAEILPSRGLCRFPCRLGGRRADAGSRRVHPHLHD